MKMRSGIFLLLLLLGAAAQAQLGGWSNRLPIQLTEQQGQGVSLFPVLLTINTEALVQSGAMAADGRDLRFADSCGLVEYPHWVAEALNTDSTLVWVQVPALPANGTFDLFMYCGQPQAVDAGDFAAVFPNAVASGGSNLSLSGAVAGDWFEVEGGDTLFIQAGQPLEIEARMVRIAGTVMGAGAGFASPAFGGAGLGPGGGGNSTNAGSGGGGNGGAGGLGGYDFGDSPGAGGAVQGTPYGLDWTMGASGGSAALRLGGAGGGALRLTAELIDVPGGIVCDGLEAQQPGAAQGGGGGAGGSILLQGVRLRLNGNLSAVGGRGSRGFSSGNDDGGGGGGGRIKLFHDQGLQLGGMPSVDGGAGGVNGSVGTGDPGEAGTLVDSTFDFARVEAVVLPLTVNPLPPDLALVQVPEPACAGDSVGFALPQGYGNYVFQNNGVQAQAGPDSLWGSVGLVDGDQVTALAEQLGCSFRDTARVAFVPNPEMSIVASDSSSCLGDTVFLDAGQGWASVNWSNGATGSTYPAIFSGIYIATGLDTNGCGAIDTFIVNQSSPPLTNIAVTGLPVCEGDTVELSSSNVHPQYAWSNGDSGRTTLVNASGTYFLTVTNAVGCSSVFSSMVSLDTLPEPPLTLNGDSLLTDPNYFGYQWCLGGSVIGGATSYFYETTSNGIYTVKVQDGNGCWGASDTLMIGVAVVDHWEPAVKVWPSPFIDRFRIAVVEHLMEEGVLEVWDGLGRLVYRGVLEGVQEVGFWEVDAEEWAPGWYTLTWKTELGSWSRILLKRAE